MRLSATLSTAATRDRCGAGAKGRGTDIDRIGTRQPASVDAIGGPSQLRRSSKPPARSSAAATTQHPMSGTAAGRHHSRSSVCNLHHPGLGNGLGHDSSVKANSVRAAETCGRPASRAAVSQKGVCAVAPCLRAHVHPSAAPNASVAPHSSAASVLHALAAAGKKTVSGGRQGLRVASVVGAVPVGELGWDGDVGSHHIVEVGKGAAVPARGATVMVQGQGVAGATRWGTDNDRFGTCQPASGDAISRPSRQRRCSSPPAQLSATAPAQHPMSGIAVR